MKKLTPLGKMTVFYIPSHKLDAPGPAGENSPRAKIHEFLMKSYKAYTHTPSPVKGFWISGAGNLVHDVMERFEVSFGAEREFQTADRFGLALRATGRRSDLLDPGRRELSGFQVVGGVAIKTTSILTQPRAVRIY